MEIACPQCLRSIEYSREPPRFCSHCGQLLAETRADDDATLDYPQGTPATRAATALPRQFGDYRLIRELGRGGMGIVYQAQHIPTGRHVALKLLPPQGGDSSGAVERFLREGKLAAAISHPRSTFVYAAGEFAGQFFIAMELMPGGTIKDVVDRDGPLPIGRAVDFVLDALDGLEAAHAAGVIHRDVKPSNCFLDSDGRAKVGDYGLSKSLAGDAALTRTGSFLGTPLFAAPEQVRGDAVDAKTDVYALGATLFFLLTGRGPFEGDVTQVIAKISSDPAPGLRSIRPGTPKDLERIIARTLEKDPARRFRLDQLRQALTPFATQGASIADLGRRLAAFFLDQFLMAVVSGLLGAAAAVVLVVVWSSQTAAEFTLEPRTQALFGFVGWCLGVLYFAVCEGWWGRAVGKRLLGLAVVGGQGTPPGFFRALARAIVIPGLPQVTAIVSALVFPEGGADRPGSDSDMFFQMLSSAGTQAIHLAGWLVGLACLATMRKHNGYRGLHEFLSGTRVVSRRNSRGAGSRMPIPVMFPASAITAPGAADETAVPTASDLKPREFGPFQAVRVLGQSGTAIVWQSHDRDLDRSAWIYVHVEERPRFPESRYQIARATRPHWLQGAAASGVRWDAFEAVHGSPLVALLAARQVPWEQCRALLADLASELRAALADGSLPAALLLDQVWVDSGGRLKLLDAPLLGCSPAAEPGSSPVEEARGDPEQDDGERALTFFRQVAARCTHQRVLTGRALEFVEQLQTRPPTAETFVWAVERLEEMSQHSPVLTWDHRLGALAVSASMELPIYTLTTWLMATATILVPTLPLGLRAAIIIVPSLLVVFAVGYSFAGGPVFRFTGIQVRRRDGRHAGPLRCGWRSFVAWCPALMGWGLLALAMMQAIPHEGPSSQEQMVAALTTVALSCGFTSMLLLHLVGALVSVVSPRRGLQDFLAGTRLAPR